MKHKEDLFKGRTFTISSVIGQGRLPHKATVIQSYGFMCLCRIEKAFISGGFNELGIFKIVKNGDGTEILQDAHIDYGSPEANVPSRYSAPDSEVMTKWERIISAMKVRDSEADIVKDRKIREDQAKAEAEKLKTENIIFAKTRQSEINAELSELVKVKPVRKLMTDKKVRELVFDSFIIEKLNKNERR